LCVNSLFLSSSLYQNSIQKCMYVHTHTHTHTHTHASAHPSVIIGIWKVRQLEQPVAYPGILLGGGGVFTKFSWGQRAERAGIWRQYPPWSQGCCSIYNLVGLCQTFGMYECIFHGTGNPAFRGGLTPPPPRYPTGNSTHFSTETEINKIDDMTVSFSHPTHLNMAIGTRLVKNCVKFSVL
jgi:hypothetical protein